MASIWAWAAALRERASLARSSLPWAGAALGLVLEVVDAVLELLFLQFDPLARRGGVDTSPRLTWLIWSSICS